MSEKRVQLKHIVQGQLPSYVRDEFPLIEEFLKQYYIAQEYQGAAADLIQNIDKYIKLDETTNLLDSPFIGSSITFDDTTITLNGSLSPQGTRGFPDSYGLLKIDDEIITYTGKTEFSFTGCIRGFAGVTSLKSSFNKEELVFETSNASSHESGSKVENLSILFLKEFLSKIEKETKKWNSSKKVEFCSPLEMVNGETRLLKTATTGLFICAFHLLLSTIPPMSTLQHLKESLGH